MAETCKYIDILNETDCDLGIVHGANRILVPRRRGSIRLSVNNDQVWVVELPVLEFTGEGVPLKRVISMRDLFENETITISGDVGNSYFCQMTPRTDLGIYYGDELKNLFESIVDVKKNVWIWPNQWKHLLKKCTQARDRNHRAGTGFMAFSGNSELSYSVGYICGFLMQGALDPVMALLSSCGGRSDVKAAFALSSLPLCVPTFSEFALAIRELDFAVDRVCCVFDRSAPESWEWCEKKCRLVLADCTNLSNAADEDSLEADVRRQNADREALLSSLYAKSSKSSVASSTKLLNPGTWFRSRGLAANLEAICLKRLQVSSCTPLSYSPADAFFIANPDTSFVPVPGTSSRRGTSKSVQKCKWLGETVALSTMWDIPKDVAQAETGILARVQHPNVVAWMGYAFKEDPRVETRYREFFLVTEFMECDLHDLITDNLTDDNGSISKSRPPFPFLVAVDIALQIVEAMIHVHKCRVLHRDLKPKNILASNTGIKRHYAHAYYSIKLTDFGSSKRRDGDSHFDTRKQGTPMYMAPEVWESEDSYTWSADVYSFGLTCFEIFTGRLPFESGMPLSFAAIQEVMRGEIVFPCAHPAELKDLIQKCWAQNPDDRPCFEDIRKALWWLKLEKLQSFFRSYRVFNGIVCQK